MVVFMAVFLTSQDNLVNTGALPGEAVDDIKQEQFDMEAALKKKMDKRHNDLTKSMKARMAEKRRKKVRKLKEKHAKEIEEVRWKSIFNVWNIPSLI